MSMNQSKPPPFVWPDGGCAGRPPTSASHWRQGEVAWSPNSRYPRKAQAHLPRPRRSAALGPWPSSASTMAESWVGTFGLTRAGGNWLLLHLLESHAESALAVEGEHAGHHLVENHADA